ncbi:Rhomboid family protein [Babesia bovis T2Bo]|uniref:Rhomboid-like protease n=1 Tax=Babesia bovis TaxID=5865 RepID=A7AUD4_BABBO|nr:Rhomboid family protein [Babesia bovis T2Bo]XP_051623191.1 Rhomboid family protein [Babesia bovis T2Bo]EDO06544.2 Rhomboid family protein [Babesia bovis T2Bo]EDO06545.1 Rhomboid family protein [Babesia bovis T2Bo]|eukprot:XP_001610113.1 rhomboid 4 [Babesia bovis T2Bo]
MGDNDSNDKKNANRHSLNAIKGGFVKDMVNRGFRKKINDSDKNDDSNVDGPSNDITDKGHHRNAGIEDSENILSQAQSDTKDKPSVAKSLAEKYERGLFNRNKVDESLISKAESQPSTTPSTSMGSSEIKGARAFGGSSQVSSNAGRRVHTLADTASTDDASIRQAMSQSFSSPGVSQPEQPERASRGRNMFGMRRRPCWIRIQVKEKIFPGKMVLAISTTILMIVVFLFELLLNKTTFNGRCIGQVDYSNRLAGKSTLSFIGYVGCENNLKTTAAERGFLGAAASDAGYPDDIVTDGRLAHAPAVVDGPNVRIASIIGAVSANEVRLYNEKFRILSAIFLHAGFTHLFTNCLMNMLLLYVIEPDWGFKRTSLLYLVAGIGGNLVHTSMSPCIPCWGASGSLFGLYGAFIPYTIEHWDNLRSPLLLLLISVAFVSIEFFSFVRGVSKHAHLGGFAFGLCFGFATLKSVSAFDRGALWSRIALRFSSRLSPEAVQKHQAKVVKSAQSEEILRIKYEQGAKDSANRLRFVKRMFGIYPYGPYRMRLRDVLTRVVFLCALIAMFVFFYYSTFNERFYTWLNRAGIRFVSPLCHCGYLRDLTGPSILSKQIGSLAGKYYCFQSEALWNVFCEK